jgi:pimeloyl-ACP methyl ester carboxylesterase
MNITCHNDSESCDFSDATARICATLDNMKQPLMLLCGLLCDKTIWGDIPQRLSAVADVSVTSFRGFSSIRAMADHALAQAPQRFAVAGHSMGGRVALEMIRSAPRRISGIALLNTGVHSVRGDEPRSRDRLLRVALNQGMSALAAQWLPPLMGNDTVRSAELMPTLTAMIERFEPDAYAHQVHAMLARPEALSILPTITVPTLLLSGSDDASAPVSRHESMRRRIPHATLFEIHGAGHMAPIERPETVAVALREWLVNVRRFQAFCAQT